MIAAAAAVRVPLMTTGLWRDEATTAVDLSRGFIATIAYCITSEFGPPGYFLAVWPIARVAGTGEFALRAGSLFFGLATIAATFSLGTLVRSRATGLLAAALCAFSIRSLVLGTEARPYALGALLTALALVFFVRALREEHAAVWFAAFGVCAAGLAYVNYTGVLFVVLLAAATPPTAWWLGEGRKLGGFFLAYAAAAIAWLPWYPIAAATSGTRAPWSAPPAQFVSAAREQLGFALPFDVMHYQFASLFAFAAAGTVLAATFFTASKRRVTVTLGVCGAIAAVAVGAALIETRLQLYAPRYMYVFMPGVCVCVAAVTAALARSVAQIRSRPARAATLLAILAACGPAVSAQAGFYSRFFAQPQRSGMRAAIASLATQEAQRTVYVVAPDYLSEVFGYYARTPVSRVYFFANQSPRISVTPVAIARSIAAWNAPAAVAEAARTIRERCRALKCVRICTVVDAESADEGRLPYHRALELRDALAAGPGRLWPGTNEPIETRCTRA